MTEKFTKGEWFIREGDLIMDPSHFITTSYRSIENNIVPIVEIETDFEGIIGVEQEANAHLIAAAPEMYEMLKKFVSLAHDDNSEDYLYELRNIEQLLAKARGEA